MTVDRHTAWSGGLEPCNTMYVVLLELGTNLVRRIIGTYLKEIIQIYA